MRKLWGLIRWLPPSSALGRALNGGRESWSQTHELLRTVIRLQDEANRMYWAAHFEGKFRDPVTFEGEDRPEAQDAVKGPRVRAADLSSILGRR